MNKLELVSIVSENLNMTKKDVNTVLDGVLDVIYDSLKNDEKVVISGFGTFEVRTRVERNGINPRTGETITIPEQKSPAFKAGSLLKEIVK